MPRNSLDINSYVQHLLGNNLTPVSSENQHLAYGYPSERQVYADPLLAGKQVVIVAHSAGQPNVISESNNYIANLAAAAKALIDKDNPLDKVLRKKTIDKIAENFRQRIEENIDPSKATGDLFKGKRRSVNKNFIAEFDRAKEILSLYTQTLSKATAHSLKELEEAGHQLRSQNRATLIHRFKAPKAKRNEEQFIIYIPCGRYTRRQQALMGQPYSTNRDHDTTSHNRANLVLGNSSIARMVAGTRHEDGTVTIFHDSFTGPGARMPYTDFKGADSYKKLALKAITLINQEEIIQTLAQRQIDRMSNDELRAKIPATSNTSPPNDEKEARKLLIEAYLASPDFDLRITECYIQVVTAGQKIAAENQHEQFQYVRQMMDALDGAKIGITIQTSENSEAEAEVSYQARMGSWGVNWFRKLGRHNPLTDNTITQRQNARFINQMTRDVINHLGPIKDELEDHPAINELYALLRRPDFRKKENKINRLNKLLQGIKSEYRQALFDYFQEYNKGEENWNESLLNQLKDQVESFEERIKVYETEIYKENLDIDGQRKTHYVTNNTEIRAALGRLKEQLEPLLTSSVTNPESKAKLQHFYNSCAYLIHAQELYYEDSWHKAENNFKLQTLMASLAENLGYANTKGCKSNNDRGQRLAQKIVGNTFWTKMSASGLYTREFLNRKRTHQTAVSDVEKLERQFTTIQALHHTANTGVSGGKFEIDKVCFADNGLYGKIASLAKIKDMHPENAITKNLKWKLGLSGGAGVLLAALVVVLGLFFPPATLFIAGTGIGLAGFAAATATIGFLGTLIFGTVFTIIQNIFHDYKIQAFADEGLARAQQELVAVQRPNNSKLHQLLGVDSPGESSLFDDTDSLPIEEQPESNPATIVKNADDSPLSPRYG